MVIHVYHNLDFQLRQLLDGDARGERVDFQGVLFLCVEFLGQDQTHRYKPI